MKKFSTIIIAMALVLGLGQCKKQETPATTDPEDGLVYITVNVGDNGAKHEVYPNTGAYVFENNDVLYVGNNGHYIGTLTYNDGAFSGTITSPSTTDYLHFFFVSGLGPTAEELEEASDPVTSFNVDISDQSSKLPILSYGQSTQKYTDANATYSTILRNKCGLVKFVPSIATSQPVTISGMKTTATIDFATGSITPAETTGGITLNSESNAVKWTVLLEQAAVSNPTVTISGYNASVSVPTITNNYYNNNGVSISMTATYPTGAINGLFSVSDSKQVYFSKGNLQHVDGTWQFATNQYDYLCFPQFSDPTDYFTYDGYTCPDGWRNMSRAEWTFVITNRSVSNTLSDGARFTLATIGGSHRGMILFPDNYTHPEGTGFVAGTYNATSDYTATVSLEGWALMEAAGCVFLPAAGWLNGESLQDIGGWGSYRSTTLSDTKWAYVSTFNNAYIDLSRQRHHSTGCSVRLVWEKE